MTKVPRRNEPLMNRHPTSPLGNLRSFPVPSLDVGKTVGSSRESNINPSSTV